MASSLECRLLCASVCAYSVQGDGSVTHDPPCFAGAQFALEPSATVAGAGNINACLVGTSVDGVVVAFRGTLPPSSPDHEQTIRDWMNDLNAELVQAGGLPGLVHEGFWNALDSLWGWLLPVVLQQLGDASAGRQLLLTGHSKGAALANLAALRFKFERGLDAKVVTYAGPHPGNTDFATAYTKLIDSTRFEFADDIVPHLPPSLAFRHMFANVQFTAPYVHRLDLDYAGVGTLRYIQRDGTVVADSETLRFTRFASLAKLIATGGFAQIVADHTSRCGGGYMTGTCPAELCT